MPLPPTPKPLVQELQDNLAFLASLVASLTLLIPWVRGIIKKVCLWLYKPFSKSRQRQELILEKLDGLKAIADRLEVIEHEMKFNGGKTIKDMLFLMFSYRQHDFWRIGWPALELDESGQITLVSEMTCRLFGVVTPDALKRRSWLRFIQGGSVDEFLKAYTDTVSYQSEFSMRLKIHTEEGENRGEWELRLSPITQEHAVRKIYSGHLSPCDDMAKVVEEKIKER